MSLQNSFIKSFQNLKNCSKEKYKAEKKKSLKYKFIVWTLFSEMIVHIILIFSVFKIIFLNIEKNYNNFYDDNKENILNKTFDNSIKIKVDKNNNILINYTIKIEILNNSLDHMSNLTSYEKKHLSNLNNNTHIILNEIKNNNLKVSFTKFSINSSNIKLDTYKDEILYKLLKNNYFKLKWKYWVELFLALLTILLALLVILLDKKMIISNNLIYEIIKILSLFNINNFFQISIFLIKNFEIIDYKFEIGSKICSNVYFSLIVMASIILLFCSFLLNFFMKNEISNLIICCFFMIFEELLTSEEFNIMSKENLIDLMWKFLLYMLFICQTMITNSYEIEIKNKLNRQNKKFKALKQFLNFLNIPIIEINSEKKFFCNQAYIQEIYLNFNNHKNFEIFEKLKMLDLKFLRMNDIENKAKFIFSIQNIDLNSSFKNLNKFNKFNYYEKSYRNSLKNISEIKNKSTNFTEKMTFFQASGISTREEITNLFECFKLEIEINLQELDKEISFYDVMPNNFIQTGTKKLLIKKNCQFLIEKIGKINEEFFKNFCILFKKFKSENHIDDNEFLKLGEIIILNKSSDGKKIYDLYIRQNHQTSDFMEFTFKNKGETLNIRNSNEYDEKIENSDFKILFPQFIKKICHEIRNPIINILQLVKNLKKLNHNERLSVSKLLQDDYNNNSNINIKNPREGNSEVYDILYNNSNLNSFRMSSFDKLIIQNTNNNQYDSKINTMVNFINSNKNEKFKPNSTKSLKISVNNNINYNINNNIENGFNGTINQYVNTNNDINNLNENKMNVLDIFDQNEYLINLKKIKCISKIINFTIHEFEFLQEIIQSKNNKSFIVNKIKENFSSNKIYLNIKNEIDRIKRLFENMIRIANKKLKLEMLIDENTPQNINIDKKAIEIILFNLLSNAIKFSYSGEIIVKLFYNKEFNKLSFNISDEGIGISEEYIEQIGTFMYKINSRNNISGLGIGIYHVKLIVEALEGNLLISSKLGKGTNIYLDFKTYDKIEEIENHNSYSDYTKKNSDLINFEYDKIINDNILDEKSFKNLKKSQLEIECSKQDEIKSFINKIKRTKTTKENFSNKLSLLSDTEKEVNNRFGMKYKILINSTNNLNKISDFRNLLSEPPNFKYNFNNKISFSNLSEKNSLSNFRRNIFSGIHQNKNKANQNDIILSNSNNKKLVTQTTISSYESNLRNLFLSKISNDKNISNNNINVFNESNYDENFQSKNYNISRRDTKSEDLNIRRYNYSETKKMNINNDYKNSKTFNSRVKFNQQRHSNKIEEDSEEYSKKFKTTNNSSVGNNSNQYFYRIINDNKAQEIDIPVINFLKKHSDANENLDHDKLEKSIITVKNDYDHLKINYNDLFKSKNKRLNIPRPSNHSITIPSEFYQEMMKLNSSLHNSSSENSPKETHIKLKNDSYSVQEGNKVLNLNNNKNCFKNSLFGKPNISVLVSNPDKIYYENKNIYKTIESNNNNLKNNIYSNTLNNPNNIENKLKDSGRCSLLSNIKLAADNGIRKDKTYKFLIVDDEILIRKSQMNVIEKYFRKKKMNVELTECSDGVECLFKLYEGILNGIKYDMIFTDETMNFIRGTAMARIVKSLIGENILYDIKIFMITSYDESILSSENGNYNIDFFCSKPLSNFSLEKVFSNFKLL